MTNRASINNATFDAALALVPAPFGPLSRDSGVNLETAPHITTNSHVRYGVVGQGSVHFQISYDELTNPNSLDDVLQEAYPLQSLIRDLRAFATLMYAAGYTNLDPMSGTEEQYEAAMNLIQYFRPAWAKVPVHSFEEEMRKNKTTPSFTVSGSGASRSVVNNTVGYSLTNWVWDWGDGTKSYVKNPGPHTYAVDGTYTITLSVGGRGGIKSASKTVTVDVP